MLGFEIFDVRAWVSKGVTMHFAKTAKAEKPKRKVGSAAKKILMAAATVASISSNIALAESPRFESLQGGNAAPSLAKIQPLKELSASTLGGYVVHDELKSFALLDSKLSEAIGEISSPNLGGGELLALAELVSKIDFSQDDVNAWAEQLAFVSANAND